MWLKRKQMGFFRVGLLWYFPVYLLIYLPATIERFFDVFTHHPPFWMKMMSALTLPYQGTVFLDLPPTHFPDSISFGMISFQDLLLLLFSLF
jgi:hypothetical protein